MEIADPSLIVYTNLILNYYILIYETDTAGLDEIRIYLRFMSHRDWIRRYWAETRDIWLASRTGRRRAIIDLFESELGVVMPEATIADSAAPRDRS